MKRILGAVLAGALLAPSAYAADARMTFIVEGDLSTINALTEQPWYESHRQLAGAHWVLSLDEASESTARRLLYRNGMKSVTEDSSIYRNLPGTGFSYDGESISAQALGEVNDPELSNQASLHNAVNNLYKGMQGQRDQKHRLRIAVLDSGIQTHEDIMYKDGYSFTTMFEQEEDYNYVDSTPDGSGGSCTGGHGNQVAGVIAATQNNAKGIAGIVSSDRLDLYMGRVLSTDCNTGDEVGKLSDLFKGIMWASGASTTAETIVPVDVINISVASKTPCPTFLQTAIDEANSKGATVVVSAGNYADSVENYAPANCSGVIVVGAHSSTGEAASYSNTGDRVDVMMSGRHLTLGVDDDYVFAEGTSTATAAVTGVVAVIKENFPLLTPVQLEHVLKHTANHEVCENNCGEGAVDLEAALRYAEKVADPTVSFKHSLSLADGCEVVRENDAIKLHMTEACDSYTATVDVSYFDSVTSPVSYATVLLRRPLDAISWDDSRVEKIKRVDVDDNASVVMLNGADFSEYQYGLAACDGLWTDDKRNCPFVQPLSNEGVTLPAQCL